MKKFLTGLVVIICLLFFGVTTDVFAVSEGSAIFKFYETDEGWKATDIEGNDIIRGWAFSSSGHWYYFDSGYMVSDCIITYRGENYYFGKEGIMHTGWILFSEEDEIIYNKVSFDNVADAFRIDAIGASMSVPFSDDNNNSYKKVWCYFNEDGTMAKDEWICVNNIWYYMDGPICLINEWSVELPIDNDKTETAKFGFSGNGNMHVGWIKAIEKENAPSYIDGPYINKDDVKEFTTWVYYASNGFQAEEGWEKIGSDWFFFVEDDVYGYSMISNAILSESGYGFYFDEDGYMTKGIISLGSTKEDFVISTYDSSKNGIVKGNDIILSKNTFETYCFKDNGTQILGVYKNYFYKVDNSSLWEIKEENITANTVSGSAIKVSDINIGARIIGDFFYVDSKDNVYYFENGKLVVNKSIDYWNFTFFTDENGKVITGKDKYTYRGKTYYFYEDNISLDLGDLTIIGASLKK